MSDTGNGTRPAGPRRTSLNDARALAGLAEPLGEKALGDLWSQTMVAEFTPMPLSVEVGRYHQGRSGKLATQRLRQAGVFV